MIKIHEETKFKIIDSKPIEKLTEESDKLLGKYKYIYNMFSNGFWNHNVEFEYSSFNLNLFSEMNSQFDLEEGYLYVQCYGDERTKIVWLNFNENEVDKLVGMKKECAEYTIKYLRDLEEAGIIEIPKS
ncbi:hypothetical protein [Nosocomiicoccus ampullae]|uniref:hypothetical protein n=1 Tax=Nosocomiicoccus ampullae TaxID=489910 RepID=UPI001C5E2278|nr:hypothetical protein [Nosocomiicoccus ampullae]QYA48002.1 hypothetical protein KPF52_05985 [Nosocomiicoccus ampullae]